MSILGPPSPPAGVMGENTDTHSIDLSWWPGSNNGAGIQYYIVEGFDLREGTWRRLKTSTFMTLYRCSKAAGNLFHKVAAEV